MPVSVCVCVCVCAPVIWCCLRHLIAFHSAWWFVGDFLPFSASITWHNDIEVSPVACCLRLGLIFNANSSRDSYMRISCCFLSACHHFENWALSTSPPALVFALLHIHQLRERKNYCYFWQFANVLFCLSYVRCLLRCLFVNYLESCDSYCPVKVSSHYTICSNVSKERYLSEFHQVYNKFLFSFGLYPFTV